jgi:glycosyltransferase involved in cell wall biosynthesis
MDDLAASLGVEPVLVRWMRRNPSWHDLLALAELVRILRRERPSIVHTHAAKGGTLGRVAALVAFPRARNRPVLVHTYHGHSLSGYFSERTAAVYRAIERVLGRCTDRLLAVSDEVRDELVEMGVAPPSKFEVVPLGFDLKQFTLEDPDRQHVRESLRSELGIPSDALVVTLVARLVPIKRVDRFLSIASAIPNAHFLIVGDGELRESLRGSPEALALGERLTWAGFRRDMPAVCVGSDVVVQTSDNEGTPVALIEAQAAGVPVVSTSVGGTPSVVLDGETGWLVEPDGVDGFVRRLSALLKDESARARMGAAGQRRALERFGLERLVQRIDDIYGVLLIAPS